METKEVDIFLQHHGVLGMKWGIRRQRRLAAVGRASSKAALSTRVRQLGNLSRNPIISTVDIVRGHGLKGAARRKFSRTTAREARIKAGHAHIRDYLIHFGSTRMTDLIPVRASKANKITSVADDRRTVAVHGALWIASFLSKQAKGA